MAKWLDRMINWGFLAIPIGIALLVFLLSRLGCGQMSVEETESVMEKSSAVIYTVQKSYLLTIQTDDRNPTSRGEALHSASYISGQCKAANSRGDISL